MKLETLTQLVELFNLKRECGASLSYLDELAEQIHNFNMNSYGNQTPFVARRKKVTEFELKKWERLVEYVKPSDRIKIFDSAFGSGRDLLIAKKLGYDVYGCELSDFLYSNFLQESNFDISKVVRSDIRSIPFESEFFDVIRHNASFLHMPIIGAGYTVHKCLEESHRLLKNGGLLYIYIKEGRGFTVIDTLDGLGERSFQLYNEETLRSILEDCGFSIHRFNHYDRERNGTHILWIEAFAYKI